MGIFKALSVTTLVLLAITTAEAADDIALGKGGYRLLKAPSPYLRQHADNPINWHMWGEEAFRVAREQDKLIFLSVGYAACYWCHVMERETFSDPGTAKFLNDHFIAVKVDRERLPDVDQTYMLATELISKQSGWPNSVFLTPGLEPFFGIGYQPRAPFKDTLESIARRWQDERASVVSQAAALAGVIQRTMRRSPGAIDLTPALLREARRTLLARLDAFNGGFGTAPKFPQENVILFLLHLAERDGDRDARDAALLTIDNIIDGAIHDQLGGGFHRYVIDNAWAIPHFEKMLYTQALMVRVLLKAFELTGRGRYADVARRSLDFVLARMQYPDGGLASALGAETDGREGAHYLWSAEEFSRVLGEDETFAARVFDITDGGDVDGLNTIRLAGRAAEIAAELKLSSAAFCRRLERVIGRLRDARRGRREVPRDDKVLTGWNALMARAMAEAATILSEPRYGKAAARIQSFLIEKMGGGDGELKRSYFDGEASLEATQSDFAFAGLSALALFDQTREARWLAHALELAREMDRRFIDSEGGGLFMTRSATGFARAMDTIDKVLPSGNAAALELYVRLMNRVADIYWKHRVHAQLHAVSGRALATPRAHAAALLAGDMARRGETGPRQFAAHGAVRTSIVRTGGGTGALVRIRLTPGWHINSKRPKQAFLLPTRLDIDGVAEDAIRYPRATMRKLSFHDEPLSLYEGDVDIVARLPAGRKRKQPKRVKLHIQACSDRICLEPQTVRMLLPAPADYTGCRG